MGKLTVTFIDVGWGDSIFIEYLDDAGNYHYGLVDCNDEIENERYLSLSAYTFIKQHFELRGHDFSNDPAFFFILLTHWHADHSCGLPRIIDKWGTRHFWYPKTDEEDFDTLLAQINDPDARIERPEAVNLGKELPDLGGGVSLIPRWPPYTESGPYDSNPNNTSVVLELDYDSVRIVLTGDCTAKNWPDIIANTSKNRLRVIQAPHHGAKDGLFKGSQTPWLDFLGQDAVVALSSHIYPHRHPNQQVIDKLRAVNRKHFRTDEHFHLVFEVENGKYRTKYSHF